MARDPDPGVLLRIREFLLRGDVLDPVLFLQLVVSELVTNALTYALGPVLMELRITACAVDVVL
ncbi:hypothetical protein [Streptomyces mirabilis]|uniref:hypothetical protein n=1 Tax=Streptomyces mirabilis TaxID=68239 RepID=UPI0035715379